MTIPSEVNRSGPYTGNGATSAFDYKFKILDEKHIRVISTSVAGVDTDLVLTTNYTVTGVGDDGGGQVLLTAPLAAGCKLTLLLNVPLTQEINLFNQGAYYAEVVEAALDLNVMRLQQLQEQINRSVKVPPAFDNATIEQLIGNILDLTNAGGAINVVASVAAYLAPVAGVADLIPQVPDLTQTAVDKAAEATARAQDATNSAATSAAYATNPEDVTVPGSGGLFSSFHWYRKTLALYSSVAAGIVGIIHGSAAKADIVDADEFAIADSAGSWGLKKVLASSLFGYVAKTLGLDFFTGFVPEYVSTGAFRVGAGVGYFGGKKLQTVAATDCALNALFGVGNGCLDTGAVQANKTYFLYAVRNLTDGSVKFLASLSLLSSGSVVVPSGWEALSGCRVGILITGVNGFIYPFVQRGNKFNIGNQVWFQTASDLTTLSTSLYIPVGVSVDVSIYVSVQVSAPGVDAFITINDADAGNALISNAPTVGVAARARSGSDYPDSSIAAGYVRSNASGQLFVYIDHSSTAALSTAYVSGWKDYQCRRLFA